MPKISSMVKVKLVASMYVLGQELMGTQSISKIHCTS